MKIKNLHGFIKKAGQNLEGKLIKASKPAYCITLACMVSALPVGWAVDHWNRMEGGRLESLDMRKPVSFSGEGLKHFEGRIFRYGEYDNILGALKTYGYTSALLLGKPLMTLRNNAIRGFSAVDMDNNLMNNGEHSCIVSSVQHDQSDRFYKFNAFNYIVFDRDLVDFAVQSHEVMHCMINLDIDYPKSKDRIKYDYIVSVTEVASDMASILDHMRLTGTDDMYHLFVKPFRLPAVTDTTHSTIGALDIILADVDPQSITSAKPEDIPRLVEALIHRHLYHPRVGYDIFADPDFNGEDLSPAMRAILIDIRTKINLSAGIDDIHTERWRYKVAEALAVQLENYKDDLPKEYYDMVLANQQSLLEKYDVPDYHPVSAIPRYDTSTAKIKGQGMLDHYAPAL